MGLTKAQRYNKRMDEIFEGAREIWKKEDNLKSLKDFMREGYSKETAKYILNSRKKKNLSKKFNAWRTP